MSDRLTYLYRQGHRYWHDTRPNLRRTVAERAQQLVPDEVQRELEQRVREATRRDRGDFRSVHPCPASSADVPDEQEVRLVVLAPGATHADKDAGSAARSAARDLLSGRGSNPRQHQNMLAFLAPDRDVMEGLEHEVQRFLPWRSVVRDPRGAESRRAPSAARRPKARRQVTTVLLRLNEAWRWLPVPVQHASTNGLGGRRMVAQPMSKSSSPCHAASFGTVRLDPIRAGRDMRIVGEEVVQHLNALPGAEVKVFVEISATVRDGVSETVQRIVDENCKTLRFRSHGFEESTALCSASAFAADHHACRPRAAYPWG